jgi:hypothetical protein
MNNIDRPERTLGSAAGDHYRSRISGDEITGGSFAVEAIESVPLHSRVQNAGARSSSTSLVLLCLQFLSWLFNGGKMLRER